MKIALKWRYSVYIGNPGSLQRPCNIDGYIVHASVSLNAGETNNSKGYVGILVGRKCHENGPSVVRSGIRVD